jgi:hypothetical protein
VEADDTEFSERAAEPSSQTVQMREAAYRYLSLSFYEKVRIAQSLDLLTPEDENLPDRVKFKRVLSRVDERGLVSDFLAKIQASERASLVSHGILPNS